ncbi:spermatogenesis-associated protein 31D1-like [Eptesicus fuscus]|uniref:spermatogenesis-associated protein 31D1-like n=1 Tax=Eptesicus fuscus TaxID=29078 RepID=UPI002403CB79|nr:spermatogenesis-associated protein 31D1-like [Eptesicus fuscus]
MTFSLLLNSLPELYQSFCSEPEDCYCTLTHFSVLGVLIYFFCFLLKVLLIRIFCENEQTEKCHQGRAKRRRKGGTKKGCRYNQKEEEDIKTLIFLLKSPLGQHHDSTLFRQLLCPDPSCEVCNDTTTEMDQLLSSLALEDATLSVSPLASTAPVTEPAVPPGDLIPPPLPEPFPQPPSNLSTNPVVSLGDFPSRSPSFHSLPPEPFPPLESEFAVDSSPPPPLALPSLPTHDNQSVETPLNFNTIFIETSITQYINPSPNLALILNPTASVTYHGPPTVSVSPPPHYSLTVTQPKTTHISSKPALESSSPDSTGALATYVPQGTDHQSLSISDISCQEACVKGPLPSTLAQHDFNQVQDVGYDSKKSPESYMMSPSGENSTVSEQSKSQRQSEEALKVHLSKKFEEIIKGQLPVTVQSSLHAIQQTPSMQPHSEVEQRSLAIPVREENCLDTCQELSFIESNAQQMLEGHITMFNLRMAWGLPTKVLQSIELCKSRDTLSHSFLDYKFSSSTNMISEVASKSGGFIPLQGSSETFNHPYSATSLVGQRGQGTLRQPPSEIAHELAEEVPRIPDAGQTLLPVTNSIIGKEKERDTLRANIPPPMLPIRQTRDGHEPKDQSVDSSQGKEMKKSEPVSMPTVSRAEELNALQSKMSDALTTSKPGTSQRLNVNENKGVTTVTTESLPEKTSVLQDPISNSQMTLIDELKCKLEKRKQGQAQGQHTHVSHASDSLTNKVSLTQAQDVSSVDGAAHQVLHVHLANTGVSLEQPQEPWVPKNVSRLCQNKNFPPAAKKVRPTRSSSKELGGGDAGLGTSQPERRRFPTRNLPLKERLRSKSPQSPSQKAQSPENLFRNQMNRFFQWLHPGIKYKEQEYSQEKGSPLSSTQSTGPVKSRAVLTGLFHEEKLGCHHALAVATTCPQEPLPSAVKLVNASQKAAVWAQAEPVRGHPFNPRAPSFKMTNTQSFCQEAAFRDKDRNP